MDCKRFIQANTATRLFYGVETFARPYDFISIPTIQHYRVVIYIYIYIYIYHIIYIVDRAAATLFDHR